MADEELLSAEPELAIAGQLAASALGPLAARQESIAQILVEDSNIEKLTHLWNRTEPQTYAKANYLVALIESVARMDETNGFQFPPFDVDLIKMDYRLRTSFKKGTRKDIVSITKIFERGGEAMRGFFGRNRGR